MTMTRRNYEAVAEALARTDATPETVNAVANALVGTNPQFNRQRFIAAATPKESP